MMGNRKQGHYPYAAIIADAQAVAHTLPTRMDDMALAEAAGAAWFAWVQQVATIPPNGHMLYHIDTYAEGKYSGYSVNTGQGLAHASKVA